MRGEGEGALSHRTSGGGEQGEEGMEKGGGKEGREPSREQGKGGRAGERPQGGGEEGIEGARETVWLNPHEMAAWVRGGCVGKCDPMPTLT